ncbi:MAG: hypothetical protein EYC62_04105 [Alphaproteobacteria bacterium]|nr:MAG: hypothetical protein EYC62_04105 [Alphaproteobacteria bacterium]
METNITQTNSLPQGKLYQQWRDGRSIILVSAMACVFMLGGIMTNLVLMGKPMYGYAVALGTFFAVLGLYVFDAQAVGMRPVASKTSEQSLEIPASANDSKQNRKAA